MKFCPNCKTTKPKYDFQVDRRKSDGLCWDCKKCRKERRYKVQYTCSRCGKIFFGDKGRKFCTLLCSSIKRKVSQKGELNPNWKGGLCNNPSLYTMNARKKEPEKDKARREAYRAIEAGILLRLPCSECGNPKTDAHHDDYSKPLDVRWLCRKCHGAHHAMVRKQAKTQPSGISG